MFDTIRKKLAGELQHTLSGFHFWEDLTNQERMHALDNDREKDYYQFVFDEFDLTIAVTYFDCGLFMYNKDDITIYKWNMMDATPITPNTPKLSDELSQMLINFHNSCK